MVFQPQQEERTNATAHFFRNARSSTVIPLGFAVLFGCSQIPSRSSLMGEGFILPPGQGRVKGGGGSG